MPSHQPAGRRRLRNHDHKHERSQSEENNSNYVFSFRTFIPIICLVAAIGICYKGYLETRINTPFDKVKIVQKSGIAVPDRYWGSYRPNLYFGMKSRDPYSMVTGIMWYYPRKVRSGDDIRHWCEQKDYLKGYSWNFHDGRNFGSQSINDDGIQITTSFVKKLRGSYGGDWTARISFNLPKTDMGESSNGNQTKKASAEIVSLLFYSVIENQTVGFIEPEHYDFPGVNGWTEGLGDFKIKLNNFTGEVIHESHLYAECPSLDVIKESILSSFRAFQHKNGSYLYTFEEDGVHKSNNRRNLVVSQLTFQLPFEVDIMFESGSAFRPEILGGKFYTIELEKHTKLFDDRFDSTFKLRSKGFSEAEIMFSKAALSNLIGSIGYFYGSSRVLSEHTDSPVPYWKAALYTAVPSRSFFPRGFLWDEGFHGLLLSVWDLDIELDIIGHWFDLMNVEGWIPREQILGAEALSKVPVEFVTQINTNANPPAFFLTLDFILRNFEEQLLEQSSRLDTLDRLYNRLVAWFDWFNTTQTGTVRGTYRWRGRDPNASGELNPKTLTSGLDDYPRASHPTNDERHLDLTCWIASAASTIVAISTLLNKPCTRFIDTVSYLSNNELLDKNFWSEKEKLYGDFGYHTDDVKLVPVQPKTANSAGKMERKVLKPPVLRFVDTTFGYNSLFPLMLKIINPHNPKLGVMLSKLKDPELLWTNYGLRSLSKKSPLYMKWNTADDPPYWRGAVWINMNFLVLRALNHYSKVVGPYSQLAGEIYSQLRKNIISNLYQEFQRTGYLWEHYNDLTGRGEGSRPFTGWSSLVVLIMAETY